MKKLLLVLLAVAVSTTLGGAVLGVLAAEDYIRVVGGGPQPIGPTFTVGIDVFTDEPTFCGYHYELSYAPAKVQVDSVTFQESFPTGYFCASLIDNVAGKVVGDCARLGCAPGAFSGTDQVKMHCIASGNNIPLVLEPGTTMRDNLNGTIPITRYNGSVTCEEEAVGGIVEMQVHGSDSAARVAGDSGPSFPFYAALAGAAAAVAIAGGALYAKRRWLR